ncbi:MAG: hypothetical protein KKF68_03000 [Nanoarchaeota archaeon]|nr:hypothetical protein [Nanoarchaeota archaeon]
MNKKILLLFISGIFLISFCYGIFAAATLTSPVVYGNYSSNVATTFISITGLAGVPGITNITCYYNESGGTTNTSAVLIEMLNYTSIQASFNDSNYSGTTNLSNLVETADISYPSTAIGYNISCALYNGTSLNTTLSVTNVTIDNTNPQITFGVATLADNTKTNLYNWTYANISLTEIHNCTINFKLFYSNGSLVNTTLFTSGAASTKYINWTSLNDNIYMYNVTVNDSAGNSNTTATRTIYLDHGSPVPVLTSLNASQTTLALTIDANGGISGTNTTCWVEGVRATGSSVSGTGASQTLVEAGLTCAATYSYIVSCGDSAGNSGTSVATSFTTSSCTSDGGGLTGGSGSTTTWKNTYSPLSEELEKGYTRKLSAMNRVRVMVGSQTHHVGVKSLTGTSATVEIASTPVEIVLDVGEDAKVDVTEDGFYDIYVVLNGVENNEADLTIQKVYEEIPEEEKTSVKTSGDIVPSEGEDEEEEKTFTVLIIVLIILLVAGAIGGGIAVKRNKNK